MASGLALAVYEQLDPGFLVGSEGRSHRSPNPGRSYRTSHAQELVRGADRSECEAGKGTTAAGSRCATSRRSETLDGRLENPPSDNAARSLLPALTTAPPPSSRARNTSRFVRFFLPA